MSIVGAFEILVGEKWMQGAVCPSTDAELFFPEKGTSAKTARRICQTCPVRSNCLDYAFRNHIREGIYGGFSGKDRERLNSGRNPLRVPLNGNGHGYNCRCFTCRAAA